MFWLHICEEFCLMHDIVHLIILYMIYAYICYIVIYLNNNNKCSSINVWYWIDHVGQHQLFACTDSSLVGLSKSLLWSVFFRFIFFVYIALYSLFSANFKVTLWNRPAEVVYLCADVTRQAGWLTYSSSYLKLYLSICKLWCQVTLNKQTSRLSEYTGISPQHHIQQHFDFVLVHCQKTL